VLPPDPPPPAQPARHSASTVDLSAARFFIWAIPRISGDHKVIKCRRQHLSRAILSNHETKVRKTSAKTLPEPRSIDPGGSLQAAIRPVRAPWDGLPCRPVIAYKPRLAHWRAS
jgi:hypothetical protein